MIRHLNRPFALLTLLASLSLAGCINAELPGSGPGPKLYELSAKSTYDQNLPNVKWQLVVSEPVSASHVNTNRIALRPAPLAVEYYKGVAWADRAPRMIQTRIIESFERTNKIQAVGRDGEGLRADYALKTELREFIAIYGEGPTPQILIRMNAKLVKMPERMIVADDTFEYRETASGTDIDAVVAAYNEAMGKVLKRLVEWTLREGKAKTS
ncbi:MAG: ABC-type transport auxiliary lipoprotein family protein [Alphaproteobacteria bacterium]|nr:ABC-type transport auxiliary lipoprotein family protein [Alphaproteobacteria bacterium]